MYEPRTETDLMTLFLSWLPLIIVAVVVLVGLFLSFFTVEQQSVVIIERFGKFNRVAGPGLRFKVPLVEQIASEESLRQQETKVEVDTKTKDNVFIKLILAIQHRISNAEKAYYELDDPEGQMKSYVFNVVRATVPDMTMDEVFQAKDKLALEVKETLGEKMSSFGYVINDVLATDIAPPPEVQNAMNQVVTQERNKIANEHKGDAEKILVVKAAEAKRDQDKLHGEGIALQREAIAKGLSTAVKELEEATGMEAAAVLNLVTLTQWLDMMTKVGSTSEHVVFMSANPNSVSDISQQLQSALMVSPKLPSKSRRGRDGASASVESVEPQA